MPDFGIYAGDADKTIYVRLRDSTTGLAKTGLVYNSTGAACYYTLPAAAATQITLATQTVTGSHSDGGFVEVSGTNAKGLYRLDLPDAAIASGAFTLISIEFDGIIEETVIIPLHTRKVDVVQIASTTAAATTLKNSLGTIYSGTCTSNGTTTTIIDTGLPATDDFYNGRTVIFTSGTLAGQGTTITDYDSGTDTLTVAALTGSTSQNDTYLII